MLYGLIGEKLTHSFSKEIHGRLADYDYTLKEIEPEKLEEFFKKREFCGINVTVPYKTRVIGFLDEIDTAAENIGAVNTVVNRGGKLSGFNTDALGLTALIKKNGIEINGKKVLVLGSGGTSKTALFVAENLGAKEVIRVSRDKKDGFITYGEAADRENNAEVIINTTPCGMFPDSQSAPIGLLSFGALEAVVDVIYNPLKTRLVLEAQRRGIKATGGLYMLVAQAVGAAELFTGGSIDKSRLEEIYGDILREKLNIVLIGMPTCGKTTVGKKLSEKLGMRFFDTDEQITEKTGQTPAEIIKSRGEEYFRALESEIIALISQNNHSVIATGGGAVTVDKNLLALKSNGKLYFLDRPLEMLKSSPDRPLSSSGDALKRLYEGRIALYRSAADVIVKNDADIDSAVEIIRKDLLL